MNSSQLLTAQQKAYIHEYAPRFVHERIAAMLSTAPLDEEEVKNLLCDIYRMAKLSPPTLRWFDSPLSFVREGLRARIRHYGSLSMNEEVCSCWYGRPNDSFLWTHVGSPIHTVFTINDFHQRVREKVENRLWVYVREYLKRWRKRDTSWGSQWWGVMVGGYIHSSLAAYYRAADLACICFLQEILKQDTCSNLMRFNELILGYWLGKKEAWLVRKPVLLACDEQGRWHNASGPCVLFRDGWGWYAWHGVRMPEQIILHPLSLTKWDWIRQRNVEVRRAIQERLGNERFIEMIGGKQIDTGRRGKLIEIKLGRRDPERVARFVQVQDTSTKRQYYLRVPPLINSADEAIAWTFGMNARDYQPGQET